MLLASTISHVVQRSQCYVYPILLWLEVQRFVRSHGIKMAPWLGVAVVRLVRWVWTWDPSTTFPLVVINSYGSYGK